MLCSELFYWNFKNVYDCTVTFVVFYVNIFHLTGKGKWDDIMTQIAEGQKRSSENKLPLKEVKSKIFADFKPPKLIRPLSQYVKGHQKKKEIHSMKGNPHRSKMSTV